MPNSQIQKYDVILPIETGTRLPVVRSVSPSDLVSVLKKGLDDFWAMPTHVLFVGIVYAAVGLIIGRAALGYEFVPLIYPLVTGFALLGPFAAIGLYELSRRREMGRDPSWRHMLDFVHSPSLGSIAILALLLVVVFLIWIAMANAMYVARFGHQNFTSLAEFVNQVVTTPQGFDLFVVGNAVGLLFAVGVLSLTVIAFPLLLDRHVGIATAMATSLVAVAKNPITMALWGLIVAVALFLGALPLFIGLAVVIPVLGHATWHLYRAVVEPDTGERPEYSPPPKYKRYGAQFPASLFASSSQREDDPA